MNQFLAIAQSFADPHRVRILFALRGGERCVCQIVELLGLAPSTVSRHLAVLKHAGLIDSRKEGRWLHYRLAAGRTPLVGESLDWLFASLQRDPAVIRDAKTMKAILRMEPEVLCCRQRERAECCP